MSTITLTNILSGYNVNLVNNNFTILQTAINTDMIHVSGGQNVMGQDLDLNSHNLLNITTVNANSILLNGVSLTPSPGVISNGSVFKVSLDPTYEATLVKTTNLAASNGSSTVGFIQSSTGAIVRTVQDKISERVSVFDFMTTAQISDYKAGTLINDLTTPIQTALNSGASEIFFPAGSAKFSSLTLPNYVRMYGVNHPVGAAVGVRTGTTTLVCTLASGIGITCGISPVIENLTMLNSLGVHGYDTGSVGFSGTTAIAISTSGSGSVLIRNIRFNEWYGCLDPNGSPYYVKVEDCEFNRCYSGICPQNVTSVPYNLMIINPRVSIVNYFYIGGAAYGRNIKVFGGSIENYLTAFTQFYEVSCFGTYFEVSSTFAALAGFTTSLGFAPTSSGQVSLYGCVIYLNNHTQFIYAGGGITNVGITSSGNKLFCVTAASLYVVLPTSGNVNMVGDTLDPAFNSSTLYVPTVASRSFNIVYPTLPTGHTQASLSGITSKAIDYTLVQVSSGASNPSNGSATSYTYPTLASGAPAADYVYVTTTATSMATAFPAIANCLNGTKLAITFSAAVASATWTSTGGSFLGAPSSIVANVTYKFIYLAALGKWVSY